MAVEWLVPALAGRFFASAAYPRDGRACRHARQRDYASECVKLKPAPADTHPLFVAPVVVVAATVWLCFFFPPQASSSPILAEHGIHEQSGSIIDAV
jgi:hypothetical protein